MKAFFLLLITIFMVFSLYSLEEQSYQGRIIINESRKEELIFPLPMVNYDYIKYHIHGNNFERQFIAETVLTESVIDLCGLIPISEEI
jgi:hypothetical protein